MKNRLKDLRQLHQWSQSDLARELGVSRQAVNGFESGKFDPSLEMACKIANLFQVPIEDVFLYQAEYPMQTLVERVTKFLGFKFGFERFTEKAINALNFARNEAARSRYSQVEPAHLLAGLLADSTTTSARLLRENGAKLALESNEHSFQFRENLEFDSQCKFVLELALQMVRLRGGQSIGTEHLLWGLVQLAETEKTANELFQPYEANVVALKHQLIETI